MSFSFVSQQFPEQIALVADGRPFLKYAELHKAVQKLARQLVDRQLVFLIGENDLSTVTFYLACMASGAVPLLLGKGISARALVQLMQVYDPAYIFMPADSLGEMAGFAVLWQEGEYAMCHRPAAKIKVLHSDLAVLLATSGSTGSPKLVRLSGVNLRSNAESIVDYLGITADDRAITSLPINYSYGLSVINSHLMAGASLVLTNRSLMDANFWRQVNEHNVTSFSGVPYSYEMLLKLRFARINIPSVRTLTQAGGRLDPAKLKQVNEICRVKNIQFFTMYGQTEATARIAYLPPSDVERKLGSIGQAIPGGRLWIEDEHGQVLKTPGVVGELVYEGTNVSMGYAECPEDLALGDVNNGVLHTGDLARFDEDGYFFIEGRMHRFLKVFGIRVSLDAVEQILYDKGLTCAAHGRDDLLVLSVVEKPDLAVAELRVFMATSLGVHPSSIQIQPVPELPRLTTGKVDYQCLNLLR